MNELQRIEFDLLRQFAAVCEKLNLRYYLVCGSALGAVKYSGFIPWDDDVDVAMPRQDYERFLREAPGYLPEGLFLQNYRTDPAFPQIFTKLRSNGTTYIEKTSAHLPIHHGIYIDIFPLDGYPPGKRDQYWLEFRKRIFLHMLTTAYTEPPLLRQKIEYRIKRALGLHKCTAQIAAAYEKMVSQWPCDGSEVWCNHGNWQGRRDYSHREIFGEGTATCFEGLTVNVPVQADVYLRRKYGDYTQDPPKEEQLGHHYYTVLDCSHPYTDYVNSTVKEMRK